MLVVGSKKKKKMAKKGKEKKDMDDLKKELEMDEHCIPLDDLLKRLHSDAQTVKLRIHFSASLFSELESRGCVHSRAKAIFWGFPGRES